MSLVVTADDRLLFKGARCTRDKIRIRNVSCAGVVNWALFSSAACKDTSLSSLRWERLASANREVMPAPTIFQKPETTLY